MKKRLIHVREYVESAISEIVEEAYRHYDTPTGTALYEIERALKAIPESER